MLIHHEFKNSQQAWCSYDYHWSMVSGGKNVFILANREKSGGVDDSPYIWTDHTRWSADTPESPVSVLPLLLYASWLDLPLLDLRAAKVSVYLRGDDLALDGARCYFWAVARKTRWHMTSRPLTITEGDWAGEPETFTLTNDPSLWHKSWSLDADKPEPLNDLLAAAESFGFAFVGFGSEPTGRFAIDEFRLEPA